MKIEILPSAEEGCIYLNQGSAETLGLTIK